MARANRIWVLLMGILIAVGALGFLPNLRFGGSSEELLPPPEPLIVTIGYGNIENAIPAPGALRAAETVAVPASATGRIVELHVALGDVVEAGQLLATIDPDLDRDEAEIRAPISGTVVAVDQRVGAYVNVSEIAPTVLQIADLTKLTVDTEVFEADIAAVDDAVGVYFTTLGAGSRRWYGDGIRVNVSPVMRDNSAHYRVRFNVDNTAGELFPGMSTQAFFVISSAENVLTVPIGALSFLAAGGEARRATVETVRPDGTTEVREVVVNAADRVNAEVVSGLAAGDRVIAGTILPEIVIPEGGSDTGRRRPRDDDRLFRPEPDSP